MKNILLLAIVIGLFTSSTPTQERTRMDILTSYKWCMSQEDLEKLKSPDDGPDDPCVTAYYMMFTNTVSTTYEKWSDESDTTTISRPYYLGFKDTDFKFPDNIYYSDPSFDYSKVGKNKNGNYILEKNEITKSIYLFEIIELTEKKLVIYPVGTLGGRSTVWHAQPKD